MNYTNDVTVIGLGRVGLPLALSLRKNGLRVNGVDRDSALIESIQKGEMPFREPGYDELLQQETFNVDTDYEKIKESEFVIITVGTPLEKHIETDLKYIRSVLDEISPFIQKNHTVILRSTVSPATTEFASRYLEKQTGFKVGNGMYLAYCPERIAEGKALKELESLPQIIGTSDCESGNRAERLFSHLTSDIFITDFATAELSKLFCNISRYVYFAVSNHFMMLAEEFGANIFELLKITNYKYPRQIIASPGLTAGTCLRKDFGMINEHIPYVDLLLASWKVNEFVPNFLVKQVSERTNIHDKRIAILGYSFKRDADDLRDSLSPKLLRYVQRCVPREIRIAEPNLPVGEDLEDGLINQSIEKALEDVDVVFFATNHSLFEAKLDHIYDLCAMETWLVDIWNLCKADKLVFQKMEVVR